MKSIYTKIFFFCSLCVALFAPSFSVAQVFYQNFDETYTTVNGATTISNAAPCIPATQVWTGSAAGGSGTNYDWYRDDQTPGFSSGEDICGGNYQAPGCFEAGSYCLYFDGYDAPSGATATIISPSINLSAYTGACATVTVSFYYFDEDESGLQVEFSNNGGTSFGLVETALTAQSNSWQYKSYTIPVAYCTATFQMKFIATSDYQYYPIALDEVVVNASAGPSASVTSQTNVSCNGLSDGSVTIAGAGDTGPYTYSWAPSAGLTNPNSASPGGMSAGTYTCTIVSSNPCTGTFDVTITQPTVVSGTVTSSTGTSCGACSTGTATVAGSGGTAPYTYSWSPSTGVTGANSASASTMAEGTYTCTVTDANGCTGAVTVNIGLSQVFGWTGAVQSFTIPNCVSSITVDMAGGQGGNAYDGTGGNYNGTNNGGGRIQATVAVTGGTVLSVYVGSAGNNASSSSAGGTGGTNGSADGTGGKGNAAVPSTARGAGGGGGASSEIVVGGTRVLVAGGGGGDGDGYVCGSSHSGYDGGSGGQTGTTGTAPNAVANAGQAATQTTAGSGGTVTTCGGGAPTAGTAGNASGVGGNGGYDYYNSGSSHYAGGGGGGGGYYGGGGACDGGGGGGSSDYQSVAGFTPAVPTYTSNYNAVASTTPTAGYVIISYDVVSPSATVTTQHNMTCTPNTGSVTVSGSGGTSPYTYSWSPTTGVTGAATASPSTMAAGTYTCTITDTKGCTGTLNVTITGPTTVLSASSSHTNIACFGQTGTATAAGANGVPSYTYSWNTAPVQTTATATGLTTGSYTCTVTDADGCTATTTATITSPASALTITPTQFNATAGGCFKNGTATATASGGTTAYTYSWTPVGFTGAGTATYSALTAGTYTCTVTDANGCTASNTFTITGGANVTASITSSTNPTTCGGANGSAVAAGAGGTGPYTYSWLPSTGVTGAATSSPTTMVAGTYTCTVTDHNGCTATAIVTLSPPSGTNDNFGCATPISIQATCTPTFLSGTNNAASLESNEEIDCQGFGGGSGGYPKIKTTVWYSFTVSAATGSGPFFVNLNDQTGKNGSGGNREYYHGLTVWNTTALPATTCASCPCAPVQCMDNSDVGYSNYLALNDCRNNNDVQQVQPAFTEYSIALNNLPNGTYYLQVGYPETGDADAFQIAISTCLPSGYILTNPLPATGQGQVSAAGTCYSIAAGEPVSAASECPVAIPYVLLSGNNCSSRGNISNCTTCPSGNNNTSSSCIPCFGALATGINFSSNSVTYPAGYYPSPGSDIGSSTTTYQQVGTAEGLGTLQGGVVGSGYVTQYCYSFSTNSTSTEINANLQSYAEYLLYGGGSASGASNCTYLGSGGSASTVYWADWALYSANMGSLYGCGNINSFSVTGLGCNTTYVLCMSAQTGYGLYIAHDNTQAYSVYPWVGQNMCNPTSNLCTTVLPITLSSFQVEYEQATNSVTIYWSTASQINNKLFTVEKSVDGTNWQTVTTMDGAGTTSEAMYYNATDESPFAGISYYRLKQTDYDGTSLYSNIAPVNIPSSYSVDIFPNPTTGNMTLRYGTESPDPVSIKITDISGITVSSYTIDNVQKGMNDFTVNTSALTAGMYIIQITNPQKTFYQKFVKQ